MDENKIAVLGGGHGAHAVAADLTLKGFRVNLFELPKFANIGFFRRTMESSEIELSGVVKGVAKINLVTTNIKEALQDVSLIFVIARSNTDTLFAEVCAPNIDDGQIIVLGAGNCGSLIFFKKFKEKRIRKDVLLAESVFLPYGCRILNPSHPDASTHVRSFFSTVKFPVGVLPAKSTKKVVDRLKRLYKLTNATNNVLEAGLNNPNPIGHCTPTLLNIGRIERVAKEKLGHFALFHEGFSQAVIRAVLAVSKERENVLEALGVKSLFPTPDTTKKFLYKRYSICIPKDGVKEIWKMKAPMGSISEDRYVTEDVPYGLVTYSSIGKMVGVATPTINSVIQLFSIINKIDYMEEGRTVEKLGLSGFNIEQLNHFLYYGTS